MGNKSTILGGNKLPIMLAPIKLGKVIYEAGLIIDFIIFPFQVGILLLQNKEFSTVFPFEEIRVRDLILVQPRCKYLLVVDTRRNVTAFDVKTGFEVRCIASTFVFN